MLNKKCVNVAAAATRTQRNRHSVGDHWCDKAHSRRLLVNHTPSKEITPTKLSNNWKSFIVLVLLPAAGVYKYESRLDLWMTSIANVTRKNNKCNDSDAILYAGMMWEGRILVVPILSPTCSTNTLSLFLILLAHLQRGVMDTARQKRATSVDALQIPVCVNPYTLEKKNFPKTYFGNVRYKICILN